MEINNFWEEEANKETPIKKRNTFKGLMVIILVAIAIVYVPKLPILLVGGMEGEIQAIVGVFNTGEVFVTNEGNGEKLAAAIKISNIYDLEHADRKFAEYAARIAHKAEKYPSIDKIRIICYLEATDELGNDINSKYSVFESTREQRRGIDWESYIEMVIADYNNIYTIGMIEKQ